MTSCVVKEVEYLQKETNPDSFREKYKGGYDAPPLFAFMSNVQLVRCVRRFHLEKEKLQQKLYNNSQKNFLRS